MDMNNYNFLADYKTSPTPPNDIRAPNSMPIGREQILRADQILRKYKQGKANLEQRIIDNERWYTLRHWECMRDEKSEVQPTSAWLFNIIANKHADAMDNFPSPNILPREAGDKAEAEKLTSIIPVILEQNDFEQTYSDVMSYKLKAGTGVYGVFWDTKKLGGLGDVAVRKMDLLNLFWEPGVMDIQASANIFSVELMDNETLIAMYPKLESKLSAHDTVGISQYIHDESISTEGKSAVIDWYYKKYSGGRTVLHYVKYVNDEVLFATENMSEFAKRGLYDHGMYPFVFDPLFGIEGMPTGFSYIDIEKNPQEYIDRGDQAILKNMLANARPRFFVRKDGGVNEEEYADLTNDFIHVDGVIEDDAIRPVVAGGLSSIYLQVLATKIDELKETSGNRDVSTGGTSGGVTAASAIAAMQEAGNKLSRDHNKGAYRAFRKVCYIIIELIRQFYDNERCFRITGANGEQSYVEYSNQGIVPQERAISFGGTSMRTPVFDIEVTAQKQSPYSKMAQNELALQFFSKGFFNPQIADQALACLDMMDFDRKQFVIQKIAQNGGMYQQILQMQEQMLMLAGMVDKAYGTNYISEIAVGNPVNVTGAKGGTSARLASSEPKNVKQARTRVAESTNPG